MPEIIEQFIQNYGFLAIFLVIMLEYACFPLPSEIVLPFSGAIAAQGNINLPFLLAVSVIAGLLGSLICYSIGFFGGRALLDRVANRFPQTREGIKESNAKFDQYGNAAVMIGRIIPVCRTYISLISGIARQNLLNFLAMSAIGIAVWNIVLISFGYILGENWHKIPDLYYTYKMILIPIGLIIILVMLIRFILKKRKQI